MAHYVLSDIHGEADRFHGMLREIQFSEQDILYILGDVVDRGADGIPLLQEIMNTPNMVMILGNHDYMCLRCYSPDVTEAEIRRWGRNGNAPTMESIAKLNSAELDRLLSFINGLPTHIEVCVNGQNFYLVHGFPGENLHDEVWGRPKPDTSNPLPDCRVIIGHTPVICFAGDEDAQAAYEQELERRGEHLRIYYAPGFIDIDCCCGYSIKVKRLACLRLEDMAEFYR